MKAVERELVPDAPVFLDRDYFRWTIRFAGPHGGAIEFGAVGFSPSLLTDPVETAAQQLTRSERSPLIGRGEADRRRPRDTDRSRPAFECSTPRPQPSCPVSPR